MQRTTRIQIVLALITAYSGVSAGQTSGSWVELMAGMEKMHAAMMSIKASGNGDRDFVQLMLPHHEAALDMAKAELLHGSDPQMRRLAQEIIADQQSEIELMKLWIKQHPEHAQRR